MRFNIHGGHNPDGKIRCGATGYIKESTEDRKLAKELIRLLESHGHTCYDCTCNNGTGARDVLSKIVSKCNAHTVDVDVSLHFNASNGKGHGFEVLYKTESGSKWAKKVLNSIDKLTDLTNRGIKKRDNLYFLNNTKNVSILVECCFCDNEKDCEIYNYKIMAKAIAEGLTGESFNSAETKEESKIRIDTALIYANDTDKIATKILQWKKKKAVLLNVKDLSEYDIEHIYAIGVVANEIKAEVKIIGKDRFETVQKVLDFIK